MDDGSAPARPAPLDLDLNSANTKPDGLGGKLDRTHDEVLDDLGVPKTTLVNGSVVQLTTEGRLVKLAEQRDQALLDASTKLLNQPDPDALIQAKTLLGEAFKWLSGFEQTSSLRQRIILFMDKR